jgi:Type II CAAX prenyl endopeptidase Rce1-like
MAGAAMNLVILAGFAAGVLAWLWAVQALALGLERRRIWVLPFRHGSDSARVRGLLKLALGSGLLGVLILYPWAIGENPLRYHGDKFAPVHLGLSMQALCLMTGLLSALLAAYVWIGWAKLERRYSTSRIVYKIGKAFLIPIPLTLIEEPLFRGLVLEQFTQALPATAVGTAAALLFSAAIFAAVHFLRPQKHSWLAAVGLYYVGLVLGAVYLLSGHNYLLPIAFHAGGVFYIQATRPLARYEGPAWLIGRPTYPIAGVLGILAVTAAAGIISVQLPA